MWSGRSYELLVESVPQPAPTFSGRRNGRDAGSTLRQAPLISTPCPFAAVSRCFASPRHRDSNRLSPSKYHLQREGSHELSCPVARRSAPRPGRASTPASGPPAHAGRLEVFNRNSAICARSYSVSSTSIWGRGNDDELILSCGKKTAVNDQGALTSYPPAVGCGSVWSRRTTGGCPRGPSLVGIGPPRPRAPHRPGRCRCPGGRPDASARSVPRPPRAQR
jgi:hypothetical protein